MLEAFNLLCVVLITQNVGIMFTTVQNIDIPFLEGCETSDFRAQVREDLQQTFQILQNWIADDILLTADRFSQDAG